VRAQHDRQAGVPKRFGRSSRLLRLSIIGELSARRAARIAVRRRLPHLLEPVSRGEPGRGGTGEDPVHGGRELVGR
jgi:hypothetical protein